MIMEREQKQTLLLKKLNAVVLDASSMTRRDDKFMLCML